MRLTALGSARQRALGALLYRSWFDRLALRGIVDWYLPLSRAWAAGRAADGDAEAFLATQPGRPASRRLVRTLRRLSALDRRYDEVRREWEEGFFGSGAPDLAGLERRRRAAATRLMAGRWLFLGSGLRRTAPRVRWEIPEPEIVARRHGARLVAGACADPAPPAPSFQASRPILRGGRREYWLRFPSPHLQDEAWARVVEPAGRPDPPTLIFWHGVGVESEFWPDPHEALDEAAQEAGLRIVRPEGPWHGRRSAPGYFGGEPVFARAPLGILDYFQAAVAESGALIAWARAASKGRVAVGGVSLGALTTQRLACAARVWPATQRPDALLLIAPGAQFLRIALEGALTRGVGLAERLAASGWDAAALARWTPLVEPQGAPAVDPACILAMLGAADDVTPYDDARALIEAWRVPPDNVFVAPKGHFSVSLDSAGLRRPLARLLALLQG